MSKRIVNKHNVVVTVTDAEAERLLKAGGYKLAPKESAPKASDVLTPTTPPEKTSEELEEERRKQAELLKQEEEERRKKEEERLRQEALEKEEERKEFIALLKATEVSSLDYMNLKRVSSFFDLKPASQKQEDLRAAVEEFKSTLQ